MLIICILIIFIIFSRNLFLEWISQFKYVLVIMYCTKTTAITIKYLMKKWIALIIYRVATDKQTK